MGGEDFTQENVAEMMQGWRSLNISDDLLGAWGYVPATDQSRFENGWWELQWVGNLNHGISPFIERRWLILY